MTATVMILALLIPLVMAILLILLEPLANQGLLRRASAVIATTAVLTTLLVVLCTLLLVYGPIVRSPSARDTAPQERTKKAESAVQSDLTAGPGPSAPRPSEKGEQSQGKGTPVTQSDSLILRAADTTPVWAAFLVAFVVVYGTARNETPLSRKISSILAISFSLLSTIGLARLVGYSSQMHRPPTWLGAVQDTLDFTLLPCVACTFAMLFSFVLLLIGEAFSPRVPAADGQDASTPASGKGPRMKVVKCVWEKLKRHARHEKQSSEAGKGC